jgi:hypothetical protein
LVALLLVVVPFVQNVEHHRVVARLADAAVDSGWDDQGFGGAGAGLVDGQQVG